MLIKDYRNMKNIERLGCETIHRSYNLLEHSYMVGMLFSYFAKREEICYDIQVWKRILHHDILETITGDLPHPVKTLNGVTRKAWEVIEDEVILRNPRMTHYSDLELKKAMTPEQHKLFKVCDLLDLWIFVKEEIALGNTSVEIAKVERLCTALVKGKFNSVDMYMAKYEF